MGEWYFNFMSKIYNLFEKIWCLNFKIMFNDMFELMSDLKNFNEYLN